MAILYGAVRECTGSEVRQFGGSGRQEQFGGSAVRRYKSGSKVRKFEGSIVRQYLAHVQRLTFHVKRAWFDSMAVQEQFRSSVVRGDARSPSIMFGSRLIAAD